MELGKTVYLDFVTHDPTTNVCTDADILPEAQVFEEDDDTAMLTPTVTKRVGHTGNYRITLPCTTANGFEEGKSYSVVAEFTVSGVTSKVVVSNFIIENMKAKLAALLNDAAPASFEPDMTLYPEPIAPPTLDEVFGAESFHPFTEIFLSKYDQENKVWKAEQVEGEIPADLRAEVLLHQTAIDIYEDLKGEWDDDYSVQKNVQWRAYLAERLLEVAI